jgi:hypothetical protein
MGRPRKTVDQTKLRNLALIGCTIESMARHLGVCRDTLENRYRKVIEEGRSDGETRILAKTFQAAMRGTRWALELSLINRCGWSNRPETVVNVTQNAGPPVFRIPSREEMKARYEEADKLIALLEAEQQPEPDPGDGG